MMVSCRAFIKAEGIAISHNYLLWSYLHYSDAARFVGLGSGTRISSSPPKIK